MTGFVIDKELEKPIYTEEGLKEWRSKHLSKSSSDHVFDPEDEHAMERALKEYVKEAHPDKGFNNEWMKSYTWNKTTLPLSKIAGERRTKGRNMHKVEEITEAIKEGRNMPPLIVVDDPEYNVGDKYGLLDGYHRWLAYKHMGRGTVQVYLGKKD